MTSVGFHAGLLAGLAPPLPPLPEQRRIVAEIEKQFTRLDASVAALKRVQANLKRYRASVLNAACEGALVPTEAELARSEGRDYEPADRLLSAHPGRAPRPLGVPGEPRAQVQRARRAGHVQPAKAAGGWVWSRLRPDGVNTRRRHSCFCHSRRSMNGLVLRSSVSSAQTLVDYEDYRSPDGTQGPRPLYCHRATTLFG